MKDINTQVQELARQIGDPYGFESETVDYIASELQISTDEVLEIFEEISEPEYDGQPDEAQEWYDFDPDC